MKTILLPAWWIPLALFLLHQFMQKILGWNHLWVDSYLDDLLCMPVFLGLVLVERRWWLRQPAYCFPLFDTLLMILALSLIYEEIFPLISSQFTKDLWDYFYYFAGGIFFYFCINKK